MSINISELIWTVICFFVLLVVLKKLLFDPLVSFMAARDARIQDGLSAGRTAQQQLDAAARDRSEAQRKQAACAPRAEQRIANPLCRPGAQQQPDCAQQIINNPRSSSEKQSHTSLQQLQ